MRGSTEELNQSEKAYTHTGKLGDKGIEVRIRKIKEEGEIHVN